MKQKKISLIIVFICLLIPVSGCPGTQAQKRIVAFNNATQMTASNIDKAYGFLNEQYFNAQVQRLINDYEQNPATANPRKIEEFIKAECYQARIDILKGLTKYAESLTDIMSDDQLNEFDETTKELGQELKDFSTSDLKKRYLKGFLTEEEAEILATAVNAMGRYFIEYKRHETIKKIVSDMNIYVADICDLFLKEQENVRTQLQATYREMLKERNEFLTKNYSQLPHQFRVEEVKSLAQLVVQEKQANRMLDGVENSLSTLKEAHGKLEQAFTDNPDELDEIIEVLFAEGRRLRSFYKSLNE